MLAIGLYLLFARFKLDTNFIAIVTTILSLAAIVFFTINAINAAGVPQGGEFQLNSYTTNAQFKPSVAADASGNFTPTMGRNVPFSSPA